LILELLDSFVDPEGIVRIPAHSVESVHQDNERHEIIASLELVHVPDIAVVTGIDPKQISRQLQQLGADRRRPEWNRIRGLWGLPETYNEFQDYLDKAYFEQQEAYELELEAERERRSEQRERRAELQQKLVDAFPQWVHEDRIQQEVILHIGPPNSGKTHDALQALVAAGTGWYLAPLRLLAYEIFDRLNSQGVACNLLTGEEHIPIPGAQFTAATIEMFNANHSGECIIIDEAQMLADPDRGWAWTRAMIEATAPEIHMIAPHTAQTLIQSMANAADLPIRVIPHERLTPIRVSEVHHTLSDLPDHTILVAFSRRRVLELKLELEQRGRTVSVVYGALPPEVRRRQSDRFANGETEICIATDAVGMGLNLPADYVVFYEVDKYDGRNTRKLRPEEVQQIGGRAGRYGISQDGVISATTRKALKHVRKQFRQTPTPLSKARIAPQLEDLELIPGNLSEKLREWSKLKSIPERLRGLLQIAHLEERIALAEMLTDREVEQLGLAAALKLVNAPTRTSTHEYWRACSKKLVAGQPMPLPTAPPTEITNTHDLGQVEYSVSCADIYMWLAHREEFGDCGPHLEDVREMRMAWSTQIDEALLNKIKDVRLCSQCRKVLPDRYPYGICDACYSGRYIDRDYQRYN
jgi:ATP-dependent RNA helicase SUPV3L1/SUV3